MSNRTLVIAIAAILVLFAGGVFAFRQFGNKEVTGVDLYNSEQAGQEQETNTTAPETASTTPPVAGVAGCTRNFDANKLTNDKVNIQNRIVEIDVKDFGKIQLEFFEKDAPKAVENFLRLANSGYYDCVTFHRVAKGFVIQGGDPQGDGTGGQSAFGQAFADELNPETPSYKTGYVKGVLAMANSGPNTNGSQFFIMLDDATDWMPHNYTIFGRVKSGQDVVDKIAQVPITPGMGPTDGAPVTPVVMQTVKIIK